MALLGGVVGTLVFTVVYRLIEAPLIQPLAYGKITWADVLKAPSLLIAVVMAVLIITAVRILPTRRDEATTF